MKTASLATGIASISISVIFWCLILVTGLMNHDKESLTALGFVMLWLFFGCPVILVLTIVSLVTAFKKSKTTQIHLSAESMKKPRIISMVAAGMLVTPFLIGLISSMVS